MAPLPSMHAAIRPIIRGRGLSRTIKQKNNNIPRMCMCNLKNQSVQIHSKKG